jgi:hypothetical protein
MIFLHKLELIAAEIKQGKNYYRYKKVDGRRSQGYDFAKL